MTTLRFLIAPVRSGTTAIMRCFAESSSIWTSTHEIKKSLSKENPPSYSIYDFHQGRVLFLLYKCTFGYKSIEYCNYDPFRDNRDIFLTKSLFLFRNPIYTFASWERQGWGNVCLYLSAYRHSFNLFRRAKAVLPSTATCIYENITANGEFALARISDYWQLPQGQALVQWPSSLGPPTARGPGLESDGAINSRFWAGVKSRIHDSLIYGNQILENRNKSGKIEKLDELRITSLLLPLYEEAKLHCVTRR